MDESAVRHGCVRRHRNCSSPFKPLGGNNERISTVEMTVKKKEEETIPFCCKSTFDLHIVKTVRQVLVLNPIVLVIIIKNNKECCFRALLFD